MIDLGKDKDIQAPKTIDPSLPMTYSSSPALVPGSLQLATMEAIHPGLEPVLSFIDFTASEPASPTTGDRYINTVTGDSSITTQAMTKDYIYEWNGTDYTETIPVAGNEIFNIGTANWYTYTVSAWVIDNKTLSHLQLIVAAKAGNEDNSGTNSNAPVLSLQKAILRAIAITPSGTNKIKVVLYDGGTYAIGATNLTIPDNVYVCGPSANLSFTTGSLVFGNYTGLEINNITKTGTGYPLQKVLGSGTVSLKIHGTCLCGTAGLLNQDAGDVFLDMTIGISDGSTNPSFIQVLSGNLTIRGHVISTSGVSSIALRTEGSGIIRANINRMSSSGSAMTMADTSHIGLITEKMEGTINHSGSATYSLYNGGEVKKTPGESIGFSNVVTNSVQPYFHAHRSTVDTAVTGDGTVKTVIYDTIGKNVGGHYNNTTGVFTAAKDGVYSRLGSARISESTASHSRAYIRLTNSNESWFGTEVNPFYVQQLQGSKTLTFSVSKPCVYMDQGDTSTIDVMVDGGTKTINILSGQDYSHTAGYLNG